MDRKFPLLGSLVLLSVTTQARADLQQPNFARQQQEAQRAAQQQAQREAQQRALQQQQIQDQLRAQQHAEQQHALRSAQQRAQQQALHRQQIQDQLRAQQQALEHQRALQEAERHARTVAYLAAIKAYRTGGIEKDYARAVADLAMSARVKADLESFRRELLESTELPLRDDVLIASMVLKNVNAITGLIRGLAQVRFRLRGGALGPVASRAVSIPDITLSVLEDALEKGEFDDEFIELSFAINTAKAELSATSPLSAFLVTWGEFATKIADLVKIPGDQRELRAEVERQVANLDAAIKSYEQRMASAQEVITLRNDMVKAIDTFLQKHP